MFHQIIDLCSLQDHFPTNQLPKNYQKGQVCGHFFHVQLHEAKEKAIQLAITEPDYNTDVRLKKRYAYDFIEKVLFHNPVWDIGMQHYQAKKNPNKDYTTQIEHISNYTFNCICPCSVVFQNWHQHLKINEFERFTPCHTHVFQKPIYLVKHIFGNQQDFYHRLILRCVQLIYAQTVCKLKLQHEYQCNNLQKMKCPIPKQSVKLPTATHSDRIFKTFKFIR